MALMPGPDNLYVVTESLAKGKRNGLWIAFGLNSGVLVHTLAVASGLSLALKQSEVLYLIITYLGVAYLLYLAYQAAKEKPLNLSLGADYQKESAFKLFRIGFLMNLLNPKVSLFFIAFLPQFVRKGESLSVFSQFVLLGVSFMLIGFITFASFALLAHQLRAMIQKPIFWKITKWVKVIVLLFMATLLLWV
jgi:threonine/homoserine/homoserine lactone efflux protein